MTHILSRDFTLYEIWGIFPNLTTHLLNIYSFEKLFHPPEHIVDLDSKLIINSI